MNVACGCVISLATDEDCDVQSEAICVGNLYEIFLCIFDWLMEQRILLRLKRCVVHVYGWRASSSRVFRGVCIIPPQAFSPSGDRSKDPGKGLIPLLLEQVAVEM